MTLTPKQRSRIYRKAAEFLFDNPTYNNNGGYRGCCNAIEKTSKVYYAAQNSDSLPELYLFDTGYLCWWPLNSESIEPRILCLLLCEQIALNPQR